MATSIEDSIPSDHRLVLSNGQVARVMAIGTDWTILNISARLAFGDFGANITGTPRFYMGVLANPTAGVLTNGPLNGASTSHFVGAISQGATWTRATGPVRYSTASNASWKGKKVGATITGIGTAGDGRFMSGDTSLRVYLQVQITKGSPNFSIRHCTKTTANVPIDVTNLDLQGTCNQASPIVEVANMMNSFGVNTYAEIASGQFSIAVNEAVDGFLNAVCVAWDRSNPVCYVSELQFVKIF